MKGIMIISIIAMFLMIGIVSAGQVTQLNIVRNATIHSDGTVSYGTTPITNVGVIGFICPDGACTSVGQKIFDTNTGGSSSITLNYPTTDTTQYYGTYFYKKDWIGYEVASNGKGTQTAPALTVYLAKKEQCYAPITNLQVLKSIEPNKPLSIDVTTDIDSITHAAIQNAGPLEYNPQVVIDSRLINTSVTLNIRNESGFLVNTSTKYVFIDYSGAETTHFEYVFTKTGKYTIEVRTGVPDLKCLSDVPQTESAQTQVIYGNETNYSYSLIQNLSMNPINPSVNESILFSFDYLSNRVNSTGDLNAINTSIYTKITRNNTIVDQNYFLLNQIGTTSFKHFNFTEALTSPGTYFLEVRGVPNGTISSTSDIVSIQTIEFVIGGIPDNETCVTNCSNGGNDTNQTAINGVCGVIFNSCSVGTLNDILDSPTQYLWQCLGSNGGTNASCSLAIPTNQTNQTCTSFTYSSWSACNSSSLQTRSILTSSPPGCVGGSPVLVQSCNYNDGGNGGSGGGHGSSKINNKTYDITSSDRVLSVNDVMLNDSGILLNNQTSNGNGFSLWILILFILIVLAILILLYVILIK
jgi:hypothetical protein